MDSSDLLGIDRSMELLSRLQRAIADYSKREEQLIKEFGKARHGTSRQHRQALEDLETLAEERLKEAEAFFSSEEERFRATYEGRRAWIHRAHTACIKKVLTRARQVKEREIGDLQFRHLQAQRNLPLKLKDADQAYTQFLSELSERRDSWGISSNPS